MRTQPYPKVIRLADTCGASDNMNIDTFPEAKLHTDLGSRKHPKVEAIFGRTPQP